MSQCQKMKFDHSETKPHDPRAAAQYIEAMARDLKGLASGSGLGFLAYLLGMVETDASSVVRQTDRMRDSDLGKS